MSRRPVVDALNRIAFAAEVLEDKKLSAKTFTGAAWALRTLEGDFDERWQKGEIPGVVSSKRVLDVVDRVMRGEPVPLLEELEQRLPPGLFEVRKIPGLGPKKIRTLWQELDISSLGELEYACNENRLVELKGFGKKTQEKVKAAIAELQRTRGHLRLDQMSELAEEVIARLVAAPGVERAVAAGGLRRGLETLGALELLALVPGGEPTPVVEALRALDTAASDADENEEAGPASPSVVVDAGLPRVEHRLRGTAVVVSLCDDAARWGSALVLATGSAAHVAALAARATELGVTLTPAGLAKDGARLPCPDEDSVYRALGLVGTPPERREEGVPLVLEGKERPRLVRREDLRGALHNHTTASDGTASLEEMRRGAAARGLEYLGITEHSRTASYAGGLDDARLLSQRDEIAKAPAADGCALLHGVESDILQDGSLDYPDEVLAKLDVVIASVHQRYSQRGDDMTARLVKAARNPYTDVVGHPTGRLLLGRPPAEYDVGALLDACREAGCAVELNANPARLDLNERHLAMAKERGLLVSIAADAHSVEALDHLDWGIVVARRAGLAPEHVLNTRGLDEVRAWLSERRARALAA